MAISPKFERIKMHYAMLTQVELGEKDIFGLTQSLRISKLRGCVLD